MNENNQSYYGNLCFSDILLALNSKHSAFMKSESNGKIYFNVQLWVNDHPDIYGNSASIQLSSKKEKREEEGKMYIGNFKKSEYKAPSPITDQDINKVKKEVTESLNDLPF